MLNDILDLITYAVGWVFIGASVFAGIFLAVAGYYFIEEKVSK